MDNETLWRLDHLLDKLDVPSMIRPKDLFDLNQSTALSLINTIFTYFIILVQFQTSMDTEE